MLTVQETLKLVDLNELINSYAMKVFSVTNTLFTIPDNITFREYIDEKKNNASIIINNLLNAEIREESDAILLVCHRFDDDTGDIAFELVEAEDISADDWKNRAQGYCYMAEPFWQIASYKIADTYLTQRNLIELLTDVLYEASWFGPNQERRESFIESLEESAKNLDEAKPISHLFEIIEEETGWTPEIRDPEEKEKEKKLYEKVGEYNRYCFLREVEKLRQSLNIF